MTPLEEGACELRSVRVRRSGPSDYYGAVLEFSNGQTASVPLYIPFIDGDLTHQLRAQNIANEIGRIAARSGEINPVEWILDGRIPLREYIRQRLRDARSTGRFPEGLRFTSHVAPHQRHPSDVKPYALFCICLFNGSEPVKSGEIFINVPPEFAAPDLLAFLEDSVDEVLGPESRRHALKSSVRSRSKNGGNTVVTSELQSSIQYRPGRNAIAWFKPDAESPPFGCSLGTKEVKLAEVRLERVMQFIRQAMSEGRPPTFANIKRRCAEFAQEANAGKVPARVNPSRMGAVIVYEPPSTDEQGLPKEALRLYTRVSGCPEAGFELRVNVVGPGRRGTDAMYSIICAVAPEYQLTMARVEDLRTAVREFLQDRFSSFYQAGGCFRDRDDIAFESQGKPALTLAGADKFRRVLEGRLNSKFVNACMKAGITNPFDFDLPPATVQRLGGFRSMPQPANPDLRLLNPRAVPADGTTARIRATLVWTTPGGELFRNDLEFTGIDQLVQLVRTIDCWTTESLASGHPQPPTHTGIEFLRRLCDGHHYGYRPDFP